MSGSEIGLPEALERAASELSALADQIRPANGDPAQLARELSESQARELLAWLLSNETSAGEELALDWAAAPETSGLALGIDPDSLPKAARKVLKRLTHRLRSQGVEVATPVPAPRAAALAPVDEKIDEARISAPDPYGSRVSYLAVDRPAGGVRIFQVVFDAETGIQDFELFETGRSRTRRFLRDLSHRDRWPAVEAPPASVRALIAEAVAGHSKERALPSGFGDWRARLCECDDSTPKLGSLVREALGTEPEFDFDRVLAWVEAGDLGPWPPPIEGLRELLKRLEAIAEGEVVLSTAAREEQIDAAIDETLEKAYDEARHARLADRFDETAYVWWKAGREDDARQVLAAGSVFRTRAAPALRLARAMLVLALRPALERARRPKDEASDGTESAPSVVTG